MTCVFLTCGGNGFCSSLLSIVVSVTFSFHAVGLFSPFWFCEGPGCHLTGLFFTCSDGSCSINVENTGLLVVGLIVFASSVFLVVTTFIVFNCTSYKYLKLDPHLALGFGGWFIVQEILTIVLLVIAAVKYDRLGWSIYIFTVGGIFCMFIVILIVLYHWCKARPSVGSEGTNPIPEKDFA
ncbi:hypothetical protein MAR_037860 [Mya arenaria]|uniref:Uncharacterized protein n=1 Tax=Mya arenaria TaxID=6604 RepID=A0ABY7FYK1_MYAAR|nr:uncharacterized protein LOC128214530 [Mya arenaria]WAR24191.1 hypothetical protein MAR_037860 [Mya arenaria]